MILAVTALDVILAAPVAFVAGGVAGLAAASRWRIVRRSDYERPREE